MQSMFWSWGRWYLGSTLDIRLVSNSNVFKQHRMKNIFQKYFIGAYLFYEQN